MSRLKGNLHTTIPVLYYYLSLHLPLPVRLVLSYVSVLLLSIISLQLEELPELLWNDYFEFFVRQFIDIHFFRVSSWSCMLFLWLYHISPSLHDPCNLVFLKKQSPFPVIRLALAGKVLHQSPWPETLDRPVVRDPGWAAWWGPRAEPDVRIHRQAFSFFLPWKDF